jgi:hypothetical protein
MIVVSSRSVSSLFTGSRYGYVLSVIGRLMRIKVNLRGLVHRFNSSLVNNGVLVLVALRVHPYNNNQVMDMAWVLAEHLLGFLGLILGREDDMCSQRYIIPIPLCVGLAFNKTRNYSY